MSACSVHKSIKKTILETQRLYISGTWWFFPACARCKKNEHVRVPVRTFEINKTYAEIDGN